MGKPKAFLRKPMKAPKGKPQPLRTPDDFQQAADAEEETGGKWRAGDQAKSCRAFIRAIQIYNDGLQKHPKNFDLAYNKARLEFDLSQQPTLVPKLPMPLVELLRQALDSHKYALGLNEENADILFNTAQVMISLAELAADAGSQADAIPLLREALEVLSACFSRQEMLQEEQQAQFNQAEDEPDSMQEAVQPPEQNVNTDEDAESEPEEQLVSIQADITPEDLLDTARASISALTLLVSLEEPSNIPTLAQMAYTLTDSKIPLCLKGLEPEQRTQVEPEVALERAEFIAALANADFKIGSITIEDILSRFQVFDQFDLNTNVPAMCICADALVELASTAQHFGDPETGSTCWAQLTKAQDLYSRAIKVNNDESKDRKAQIYESRGDVELLRFRLANTADYGLATAIQSSAPTLAKNAGTFYRGASNLFRAEGDADAAKKAELRSLIAAVLEGKINGQAETQAAALKQRGDEAAQVAVDMIREGLISTEWDNGLY